MNLVILVDEQGNYKKAGIGHMLALDILTYDERSFKDMRVRIYQEAEDKSLQFVHDCPALEYAKQIDEQIRAGQS